MYLQKAISKKTLRKKTYFLLAFCQPLTKKAGSGSDRIRKIVVRILGSVSVVTKNVTYPQHWNGTLLGALITERTGEVGQFSIWVGGWGKG
jgi:hypothetical protein